GAPNLLGVGFHSGLADRDLAVAADAPLTALADGENGGAVPDVGWLLHGDMPVAQGCRGAFIVMQTAGGQRWRSRRPPVKRARFNTQGSFEGAWPQTCFQLPPFRCPSRV